MNKQIEYGMLHVYPMDDIKDHVLLATYCCNPDLENGVLVHHSFDERELVEEQLVELGLTFGPWKWIWR